MKEPYASSSFAQLSPDTITAFIDLDRNGLGSTSKGVSDEVKRLCGLCLPSDQLPKVPLNEYYDQCVEARARIKKDARDPRADLQFLCYFSGFFHELRHAHDLLSTTYGQDLFFNRLNLYQNLPAMLSLIATHQKDNPMSSVGIPILNDDIAKIALGQDFEKIITKYDSFSKGLAAFEMPRLSSYDRFSVRHLLEASATLTQFDFVFDLYGEEGYQRISQYVSGSPNSEIYLRLINKFSAQMSDAGFRGYGASAVHCQLIWTALNGATSHNMLAQDGVSSVVLYEALSAKLIRSVKERRASESHAEWASRCCSEFFDDWGLMQAKETVIRSSKRLHERANRLSEATNEASLVGDRARATDISQHFSNLYDDLTSHAVDHTSDFFSQRIYVYKAVAGAYPAIAVKCKRDGVINDFESVGYSNVDFEVLNDVTFFSVLFDVLVEGRHSSGLSALENMYYRVLCDEGWNGIKLTFHDKSVIFDW
ncbi:MAG: hypothetical protein ABJV68_18060 [Paracoccaceae bacterium]